jgi:hypothetical protein
MERERWVEYEKTKRRPQEHSQPDAMKQRKWEYVKIDQQIQNNQFFIQENSP